MIPLNNNNSHVYIKLPRETTENIVSRYMLRNTINGILKHANITQKIKGREMGVRAR